MKASNNGNVGRKSHGNHSTSVTIASNAAASTVPGTALQTPPNTQSAPGAGFVSGPDLFSSSKCNQSNIDLPLSEALRQSVLSLPSPQGSAISGPLGPGLFVNNGENTFLSGIDRKSCLPSSPFAITNLFNSKVFGQLNRFSQCSYLLLKGYQKKAFKLTQLLFNF